MKLVCSKGVPHDAAFVEFAVSGFDFLVAGAWSRTPLAFRSILVTAESYGLHCRMGSEGALEQRVSAAIVASCRSDVAHTQFFSASGTL